MTIAPAFDVRSEDRQAVDQHRRFACSFDVVDLAEAGKQFVAIAMGANNRGVALVNIAASSVGTNAINTLSLRVLEKAGGTVGGGDVVTTMVDLNRQDARDGDAKVPVVTNGANAPTSPAVVWTTPQVSGQNPSGKNADYTEYDQPLYLPLSKWAVSYLEITNVASSSGAGTLSMVLGFETMA